MRKLLGFVLAVAAFLGASASQAQAVVARAWAQTGSMPGTVRFGWDYRGGQCQVRYTESNQQAYKYSTVANCDDLAVIISYLTPGTSYRLTVSQDGVDWSKPVYAVAARGTVVTVTTSPAGTAQVVQKQTTAEQLPYSDFKAQTYRGCTHQGSMTTPGALNTDERQSGKCGTGALNVRTVSGRESGAVTVYWTPNTVSDGQYHVVYGDQSGVYKWGALNVGGASNSYTVRGLTPGQRYYFKLVPLNQGKPAGYSVEVSDVAR